MGRKLRASFPLIPPTCISKGRVKLSAEKRYTTETQGSGVQDRKDRSGILNPLTFHPFPLGDVENFPCQLSPRLVPHKPTGS